MYYIASNKYAISGLFGVAHSLVVGVGLKTTSPYSTNAASQSEQGVYALARLSLSSAQENKPPLFHKGSKTW